MGALLVLDGTLTTTQLAAARLDAAGAKPSKIAKKLGVARETVSRWRGLPAYQQAVHGVMAELDAALLMDARQLREKALGAVFKAVEAARALLEEDARLGKLEHLPEGVTRMAPSDVVRLGAHCLDVYRAVSAQTGAPEATATIHRTEVVIDVDGLTEDELRLLAYAGADTP